MRRWSICLALVGLIFLGCQAQEVTPPEPATTVFIVRHAEKADDGTDDPPLTTEGQARAALLARMLRDAGVDAIYSTRFRRNQGTAAPLAEALGLPVTTHEAQGPALADTLLARHRGQEVLVIGHSNTAPMLLNAFVGEDRFEMLDEDEYDALFVATVRGRGDADVTLLRFGE